MDKNKERNLIVAIPKDLHIKLKVYCVTKDIEIKDYVRIVLTKELK